MYVCCMCIPRVGHGANVLSWATAVCFRLGLTERFVGMVSVGYLLGRALKVSVGYFFGVCSLPAGHGSWEFLVMGPV